MKGSLPMFRATLHPPHELGVGDVVVTEAAACRADTHTIVEWFVRNCKQKCSANAVFICVCIISSVRVGLILCVK